MRILKIAVIFAGGVGSRMHSRDIPKQFLYIHGIPIIARTVKNFNDHPDIDGIVIVSVADWKNKCHDIVKNHNLSKVIGIVSGGTTSQESIFSGLEFVYQKYKNDKVIVLIHDGVRPLITNQVISDNINSVMKFGNGITCVKCKETVLITDGEKVNSIPSREKLLLARAPQSFWLAELYQAHLVARKNNINTYIDSANLMRDYGLILHPVLGNDENIKITTPEDFFALQAIYNSRENEQIYGI